MKTTLTVIAALLFAGSAFAADSCKDQAKEKKLAGAAATSFVKKCEADAKAATPQGKCEADAGEKKLAGAAKNSFVKKCVADAKASTPEGKCEMQAKEKKLAGAAKNSFVKKCVTDGGTAPAADAKPAAKADAKAAK